MASITLENLNKTYPNGFVSVKNLSLHIEDGEFVTFSDQAAAENPPYFA